MKKIKTFALVTALLSCYAHAAEVQKPRIIETYPLDYPIEAKNSGHQGTVVVEVKILANDTISTPSIKTSSRSALLDQAALSMIQQSKFAHGTNNDGNPVDTVVAIPVNFRKDSSADLNEKLCDDFVIDYQWFTQTYPELKPKDMTIYKLALGLQVMQKTSTEQKLRLAKNFDSVFQKTYSDCAANRLLKFMPTLLGNME